jgi:hypothetical protein
MTMIRKPLARAAPAIAGAALAVFLGCSSSGGGGSGGSGGGGNSGDLLFKPCAASAYVRGFAIELLQPDGDAAYSQLNGAVTDRVSPREVWQQVASEGNCRVEAGPTLNCTAACASEEECGGTQCVPRPKAQSVGNLTLTGVGATAPVMPTSGGVYYTSLPYPPFAPGDAVTLQAAGGVYPAFTLTGRGIAPMVFSGAGLPTVTMGQSFTTTWTAPAQSGAAKVTVRLEIAHHGGLAARLLCDVPDTGTITIPAALITKLIEQGTAGFPTVSVTRQTVDSTMLAHGCVELKVASAIERPVMVQGVTSCNDLVDPPILCPPGLTCGGDLKCH